MPNEATIEQPVAESPLAKARAAKAAKRAAKAAAAPVSEGSITINKADLEQFIEKTVAARLAAQSAPDGNVAGAFVEGLREVLRDNSEQNRLVATQVLEKSGKSENDLTDYPAISVFNPKGDRDFPRPTFRGSNGKYRETWFCGADMSNFMGSLTAEEIEAFNAITDDCEYADWEATITKNGKTEVLRITAPMGDSDKVLHFPSLLTILYQLRTNRKLPEVNQILAKMVAESADPDVFIANLKNLLEQAKAPTV